MKDTNTTEAQELIRDTFAQLLAAMVENPDKTNVRLVSGSHKAILVLTCAKPDYGAVLGKKGSTLAAFKELARVAGMINHIEVEVLLDEPGCPVDGRQRRKFQPAPAWDPSEFEKLAQLTLYGIFGQTSVSLDHLSGSKSKLTVVPMLAEGWAPVDEQEAKRVEDALWSTLNCAAVMTGRHISVELIA